jgi:hypothetical protein
VKSGIHRYGIPVSLRRRGFAAIRAARDVGPQGRALPDFLLIGGQRCGSTSLHQYLSRHPAIGMAFRKEVSFFDANWTRGERWYRAHFPSALTRQLAERRSGGQFLTGEATPYYVFHPAVPARVRQLLPDVRLIVLLREPVQRAWSGWQLQRTIGTEPLTFTEALAAEPRRLEGEERRLMDDPTYRSRAHRHYSYTARGMYADQLDRWFEFFPRSQMLVLESGELFSRPADTMARVHGFLGLEDAPAESYPVAQNAMGGGSRMPDDAAAQLRARFHEPNERLFSMLGQRWAWNEA